MVERFTFDIDDGYVLASDYDALAARLAEQGDTISQLRIDVAEAQSAFERTDELWAKDRARLVEAQAEADRRTREVEACYTVQRDLKARLAEAEALLREANLVIGDAGESLLFSERKEATKLWLRINAFLVRESDSHE